jgi:hypothetical protein
MPNDLIKHRTFSTHEKQNRPGKPPKVKAKTRFADFLIDTNIWPLALVGKGVNCFGWGVVVAFTLGALSVYGYALVKPLPLTKTPLQMVRLHGVVRDADQRPVTEGFWVGVLANQQGPVHNPEGSFVLEVPESNSYDVALWRPNKEQPAHVFEGWPVEQDARGLKFQNALVLDAPARTDELSASQASMHLGEK